MDKVKPIRAVFFGSRPLGLHCLEILKGIPNLDIVASMVKPPPRNAWWVDDPYFHAPNILSSQSDLEGLDFDIGISVNYWSLIPKNLIERAPLGIVNLHHAFNLFLRGRNMNSRAILDARKADRWFHGSTLHYIDDQLDAGQVIASKACNIYEDDTAWSLFERVEQCGHDLLAEWLPRVVRTRVPGCQPSLERPPVWVGEGFGSIRCLKDINSDIVRSYDIVRAFDFNGYFEPAYTEINGKKVFLTTDDVRGREKLAQLSNGRSIYSYEWRPRV